MTPDRLVSIVVNNYNYGRFLGEAIDSALSQTYPAVEVIVVDDGSTDESREILHTYGNRIHPVLKENGGQGSALNAGFAVSRGDVVCFLDADDALLPEAVACAVRCFDDDRTAKAHWILRIVDEQGRDTGERFPRQSMPDGDLRKTAVRQGPYYDSAFLPPCSGNIWARWFLERVLPMPAVEYTHGADVYLHTLAPIYGLMRAIVEPQGVYRAHSANHYWKSRLTDAKVNEYLRRFESSARALARHLDAMGEVPAPEEWRRRNFNFLWLERLLRARQDLQDLLPENSTFVLVNDDEWGDVEAVPGHRAVSMLEHNGDYIGYPADSRDAITRLESLHASGASHVAFWWTSFWWFDEYPALRPYLRDTFACVLQNDRLLCFDLRS